MAYDIDKTDRLAIFVEDARRSGVTMLPPCINASAADFAVQDGAVRYALAALKNVGEKAMHIVTEGRGGGYASLAEFARRVDPRLINKRQLESLIAAGCFDGIEANRAGVYLLAEAILGTAQAAAEARDSAQTALFGEATGFVDDGGLAMLVPSSVSWTLAERMAQEKEAFGFFFSGHPVEAWRSVLEANGVKSFAEVAALPAPPGGGRMGVVMAGLIEEARWRTPQNGKSSRYMFVTLSDRSGQYVGSCFEEETQARIETLAKDSPAVLVQAELQWREGEDVPRVRINGVSSLADMARRTKSRLTVKVCDAIAVRALVDLVTPARGKGRGALIAEVPCSSGVARVALGSDYLLDAELEARVQQQFGAAVGVTAAPKLALVG
jgi:DNA polymerase-3 subunit alpha